MPGLNVWKAPNLVLFDDLERLGHVLGAEFSAPQRAALAALGLEDVDQALIRSSKALLDTAIGSDDALTSHRTHARSATWDDSPLVAAWAWVQEVRTGLTVTEKLHGVDLRGLRTRLELDRIREGRTAGLTNGLRRIVPELRGAGLPPTSPLVAPAFLARAEALLPALEAHASTGRGHAEARRQAGEQRRAARAEARQLVEQLFAAVDLLRQTSPELPWIGMDLVAARQWAATRPARRRGRRNGEEVEAPPEGTSVAESVGGPPVPPGDTDPPPGGTPPP